MDNVRCLTYIKTGRNVHISLGNYITVCWHSPIGSEIGAEVSNFVKFGSWNLLEILLLSNSLNYDSAGPVDEEVRIVAYISLLDCHFVSIYLFTRINLSGLFRFRIDFWNNQSIYTFW